MITRELDITSTPFCGTKIITYVIELPPDGKKIGINLLDDAYFTTPYIIDTIQNSPASNELPTHSHKSICIININGEDTITNKGSLDELHSYHTPQCKSRVNIILYRRKIYQKMDLEDICSIFDKFRPVVSHIEVHLPENIPTPKSTGEALKVTQR